MTTKELITDLINSKRTMVWEELFDTVTRYKSHLENVEGDIVECGVWRGGYSIFLAHTFPKKLVWACDSYEGFQPLDEVSHEYKSERHIPSYTMTHLGPIGISLEEVQSHFEHYGIDNVKYLKGFVNKTLPTAPIDTISILRVDVDSYSATLDVLDILYDKVSKGGMVIFDDACLRESADAIKTFLYKKNLPLTLNNPYTDEPYDLLGSVTPTDSGYYAGSYIIKE